MPAKQQQFAANNRQIAGVLGLKPVAKQLAEIGTWRARKDFPRKGPKGFGVAELLKWRAAQLEHGEESKWERSTSKGKPPELPESDSGGSPPGAEMDLFNLTAAQLSEANRNRLLRNRAIHLGLIAGEPLLVRDRIELVEHGLIPRIDEEVAAAARAQEPENGAGAAAPNIARGGPSLPDSIPSQGAMAVFLQERFQFPCSEMDIKDWKKGLRKPQPEAPLMPPPEPRGSYPFEKVAACCEWFEKWVVAPARAASGFGQMEMGDLNLSARAMNAKHQQMIDAAELQRLELDSKKRADDKNYMPRAEHFALCEGGNKIVSALVTKAIETSILAKFKAHPTILILPEEMRENILQALQAVTREANTELHYEIPQRLKELEKK